MKTIKYVTGRLDRLFGGEGNDILIDLDGVSGAHGGTGNDTIEVTFAASWDNDNQPTNAPRSDGKITGGYGDDRLTVRMNHNKFFLNLKGDEPTHSLLDGSDEIKLLGSYGNSVVDLGGGDDTFTGGSGRDRGSGQAGNDVLLGLGGNDFLSGQEGNDTLTGGVGTDTLIGGLGQDRFVYTNRQESGDLIQDFQVGEDQVFLTALLDSLGYAGNNPMADGYVRLVQGSKGTSIQLDADGLSGSERFQPLVLLAKVSAANLSANGFVF